jgi:tripartite motif-containing protein 71
VALQKGSGIGQVEFATAIAVDTDGNLYVADFYEDRIQKLNHLGQFLDVWTGGGDRIIQPQGLAWSPDGNLFAMERQLQMYEFDPDGLVMNLWSLDHHTPQVMGVDVFGNVYTSSQRSQTIERSTPGGVHIEWDDVAQGGIAVAADGTVLVGHEGSVAMYVYPDVSQSANLSP